MFFKKKNSEEEQIKKLKKDDLFQLILYSCHMTIDVYKEDIKKSIERGEEPSNDKMLKERKKYFLSVCNYFCDNYIIDEAVKARVNDLIKNPKGLDWDFEMIGISAGVLYAFFSWAVNPVGNEIEDFYNDAANALDHFQVNMMNEAMMCAIKEFLDD